MALTPGQGAAGPRLTRFGLTSADGAGLAAFYEAALGCRRTAVQRRDGALFERLMDVEGGAASFTLALGAQTIELLQFDRPGRPYPAPAAADDLIFQHFAIVVRDMAAAYGRLCSVEGWTVLSSGGPQQLPKASGGVTAFKFRDPEGHPLELLAFPKETTPSAWQSGDPDLICQGIDHSAIGVSDAAASIAFYETLGFRVASRTLNSGPEQSCLDGVERASVDVVGLAPSAPTPHLELLDYRRAGKRPPLRLKSNDVAATRLIIQVSSARKPFESYARRMEDPDGHHLIMAD